MLWSKITINSMEQRLAFSLIIQLGIVALLVSVLLLFNAISLPGAMVMIFSCALLFYLHYRKQKRQVLTAFHVIYEHLETLRLKDYNRRSKALYSSGVVQQIHQVLVTMSETKQSRKASYQSKAVLIFQLIENMTVPILIFDQGLKLHRANKSYVKLYNRPWQVDKGSGVSRLNLAYECSSWFFTEASLSRHWKIEAGQFDDGEHKYHLVLLSDVDNTVHTVEQNSRHKMFRVLNHEIRNSLTPIQSLAQTLLEQTEQEYENQLALTTIVDRSSNLLQFIRHYTELEKSVVINKTNISGGELIDGIIGMFTLHQFQVTARNIRVFADRALLEQVIINLVQNAVDAMEPGGKITISFASNIYGSEITILDSGPGIANLDNLFVPFYTTKSKGQGIGLSLSRKLIHEQSGRLTLTNHKSKGGALASIFLPHQEFSKM